MSEKPPMIAYHHDADGIASAVMYLKGKGFDFEDDGVVLYSPETFGDVSDNPDVVLDMTPTDPEWEGICFDHHPQHEDEYAYELVFADKPTAGVVYDEFKEEIPDEEKWKCVVGMSGDNQWEKTENEVWESNQELKAHSGWTYSSYGKLKWTEQPIYQMLSTLINAPARMGEVDMALEKLFDAESPVQILFDDYLRDCRDTIKSAMRDVEKDLKLVDLGSLVYIEYQSPYRLYVATKVFNTVGEKTTVSLNTNANKFSVRGPYAFSLAERLNEEKNINAGGHKGYCGGTYRDMSKKEFREIIISSSDIIG